MPPPPQGERRKYPRLSPENIRVRCSSAEGGDLHTNFAKRVLNVGLGGLCVEMVGRLRAGAKLAVDLRFDDFGGGLRSQAVIVWTDTIQEGSLETHLAGLRLVGPEYTAAVRQFLQGRDAASIAAEREAGYRKLKEQAAPAEPPRRRPLRTASIALLVVVVLYVGAFWGCVLAGRREGPGVRFRYAGAWAGSPSQERALAAAFGPLLSGFRAAGVDLVHDAP